MMCESRETVSHAARNYIDLGTTEVYLHLNQQEAVEEVKSKMKDFFRINEKEVPIYEIANRI